MVVHFRNKRFDEAMILIQRLRQLPETSNIRKIRSSRFKMLLLSWTLRIELSIALQTGTVAATLRHLAEQEEYFVKHAALFESRQRAETFLAFACCYFELDDYKNAIAFLQKVFQDETAARRNEIFFTAHVLQFIIYFEEENADLLNYLALAIRRMAAKNKAGSKSKMLLGQLASKLVSSHHEKEKRNIFSFYLEKFNELKSNRREQHASDYFDVTRWLERKLAR